MFPSARGEKVMLLTVCVCYPLTFRVSSFILGVICTAAATVDGSECLMSDGWLNDLLNGFIG